MCLRCFFLQIICDQFLAGQVILWCTYFHGFARCKNFEAVQAWQFDALPINLFSLRM